MTVGRGPGRCRQSGIPVIRRSLPPGPGGGTLTSPTLMFSSKLTCCRKHCFFMPHGDGQLPPTPRASSVVLAKPGIAEAEIAHRSQLKSAPPFCSPNPFSAELPLPLHPGWCILSSLLLCVCACVCVCMHVCACMCVPMCARTCVVITTQQQSSLGHLVLVTFADLERLMFCLKS